MTSIRNLFLQTTFRFQFLKRNLLRIVKNHPFLLWNIVEGIEKTLISERFILDRSDEDLLNGCGILPCDNSINLRILFSTITDQNELATEMGKKEVQVSKFVIERRLRMNELIEGTNRPIEVPHMERTIGEIVAKKKFVSQSVQLIRHGRQIMECTIGINRRPVSIQCRHACREKRRSTGIGQGETNVPETGSNGRMNVLVRSRILSSTLEILMVSSISLMIETPPVDSIK